MQIYSFITAYACRTHGENVTFTIIVAKKDRKLHRGGKNFALRRYDVVLSCGLQYSHASASPAAETISDKGRLRRRSVKNRSPFDCFKSAVRHPIQRRRCGRPRNRFTAAVFGLPFVRTKGNVRKIINRNIAARKSRAVRRRPTAADCCRIPTAVGEQHAKNRKCSPQPLPRGGPQSLANAHVALPAGCRPRANPVMPPSRRAKAPPKRKNPVGTLSDGICKTLRVPRYSISHVSPERSRSSTQRILDVAFTCSTCSATFSS